MKLKDNIFLIFIVMLTSPMWFCQQDGICDKASAPSVSSISRLLRGPTNQTRPGEDPRRNHSIDGILGESLSIKPFNISTFFKMEFSKYVTSKD